MIKELSYYLKTDRFSQIVEEFNTLIQEYSVSFGSNKTGDPELREKVRSFCEQQLVKSGICNNENSFINVDTEFFDNGQFVEANANRFIKDIVKAHCYQKVLWEYMGTTSLMTDISKDKMKADGFAYTDYLPSELKQKEISRQKNTITRNFSKLNDNSGFNWNKGYDPNDVIVKNGWAGSFDENHVWTYHKIDKSGKVQIADKQVANQVTIKLVKTPKGCMLYDSGDLLFNPLILLYLTQNDEVYGGTKSDTALLLKNIRAQMKALKVSNITEVYSANQKSKAADYKELLGDLAAPELTKVNYSKAEQLIKKNNENQKEVFVQNQSKELQDKINVLFHAKPQITPGEIAQAIQSNVVSIPVISSQKEDASLVKLSDKEFDSIKNLAKNLSGKKKTSFYDTCAVLSYNWDTYKSSGLSKQEFINRLYDYINNKTEYDFSYEQSLQNIIQGSLSSDFVSLQEDIKAYMPSENQDDAVAYINTIPEQKEDVKTRVYSALHNAIKNYSAIRMSTGMNIKELFDYSIKQSGGTLPKQSYVPPVLGYVNAAADDNIGSRRIFFENKISSLYKSLLNLPLPQKTVALQNLQKDFEKLAQQKPVVKIKINSQKNFQLEYSYADSNFEKLYNKEYFDFLNDYAYSIQSQAEHLFTGQTNAVADIIQIKPSFRQLDFADNTSGSMPGSIVLPSYLHTIKSRSYVAAGYTRPKILQARLKDNNALSIQSITSAKKQNHIPVSHTKTAGIKSTAVQNNEAIQAASREKPAAVNPRKLSPEEQKLMRINANYEHDRAVLAKSDPTFMAKNQFWDVGHAQGNDEMTDRDVEKLKKMMTKKKKEIILNGEK